MTNLTLKIEGPPGRVPATALATVLTETLRILEDLRVSLAPGKNLTWYLTGLKMGSAEAVMSAEDVGDDALRVGSEYVSALAVAEAGELLPAYLSGPSLKKLERMAKPFGTAGVEYLDVAVGSNGSTETARATGNASRNLARLASPRSRALGSVTGRLELISIHSKSKFQIFEPVSRRPVSCQFSDDRLDEVKDALKERVVVTGTVVRNASGQPIRVEDAEFSVLTESLPLTSLVGIDPDFTGGLPVSKYMERICS